jgi:hypothetical protein
MNEPIPEWWRDPELTDAQLQAWAEQATIDAEDEYWREQIASANIGTEKLNRRD